MGVSIKRGTQNGWFLQEFLRKWMLWGYHYFMKPPNIQRSSRGFRMFPVPSSRIKWICLNIWYLQIYWIQWLVFITPRNTGHLEDKYTPCYSQIHSSFVTSVWISILWWLNRVKSILVPHVHHFSMAFRWNQAHGHRPPSSSPSGQIQMSSIQAHRVVQTDHWGFV